MSYDVCILFQVVDSVWSVLKGNISLVLNVLTATLSLLFGGGTALLNFFLAMVGQVIYTCCINTHTHTHTHMPAHTHTHTLTRLFLHIWVQLYNLIYV